ncbi:uncharacterized protein LOC106168267 [Lingula anatina]|uniref:Uncharacterized protein LOC106168267 n=1 Tax=Lingula anatina TaxID=7574 RepID=A0A1S3IX02_LINAN|nr:uncharacterized protein LOC106168267 [Lingula anatina]|eukprot:XP_013402730.1 uncharacterized protein LOC106168267 [Lingula anatina]
MGCGGSKGTDATDPPSDRATPVTVTQSDRGTPVTVTQEISRQNTEISVHVSVVRENTRQKTEVQLTNTYEDKYKTEYDANDPSTYPPPAPPRGKKAEVFDQQEFSSIDDMVKQAPDDVRESYEALTNFLCGCGRLDYLVVRAIFVWIGSQDLNTISWNEPEGDTPIWFLCQIKNRKSSKVKFFETLCRKCHIPCVTIKGYSKAANYTVGDDMDPNEVNGSWNAVYVDSGDDSHHHDWRFVHIFWGTQAVVGFDTGKWTLVEKDGEKKNQKGEQSQGKAVFQINDFWFFTDPEAMIYRHLPEEDSQAWQLLASPLSFEEFVAQPYLRDRFFDLNLSIERGSKCRITTENGKAEAVISIPKGKSKSIVFQYELFSCSGGTGTLDRFVAPEIRQDTDQYVIPMRFTTAGDYKLDIYAKEIGVYRFFKWATCYRIICPEPVPKENVVDNQPYPLKPQNGYFGPGFHVNDLGISAETHKRGVVDADTGEVEIRFKTKPETGVQMVQPRLVSNQVHSAVLQDFVEHKKEANEDVYTVRVPEKGEYALELFAQQGNKDQSTQTNVCNYLLRCNDENLQATPFKNVSKHMAKLEEASSVGVDPISQGHQWKYIKTSDGNLTLRFKNEHGANLRCRLRMEKSNTEEGTIIDSDILQSYMKTTSEGKEDSVQLRLPQSGEYILEIDAENHGEWIKTFEYHIESAGNDKDSTDEQASIFPFHLEKGLGPTRLSEKVGVHLLYPKSGKIKTLDEIADIWVQTSEARGDVSLEYTFCMLTNDNKSTDKKKRDIRSSIVVEKKPDGNYILRANLPECGKYELKLFAKQGDCNILVHVASVRIIREAVDKVKKPLLISHHCTCVHDKTRVQLELKAKTSVQDALLSTSRPPMRIMCVIDASGSMHGNYGKENISKLEKMKTFAQVLVDYMDEVDYLGVVVFGNESHLTLGFTRMASEVKENVKETIRSIQLMGSTNLSAGLFEAIEQYRKLPLKCFDDKIVLFTDGGANCGITTSQQLIPELRDRFSAMGKESGLGEDYTIQIAAFSTGGFMPTLMYELGQAFSSETFYFMDENTLLELNMMKTVLLQQTAVARHVKVVAQALNGVVFDRTEMPQLAESPSLTTRQDDYISEHFIHTISGELSKHVLYTLLLPDDHSKTLPNKDVLEINVSYQSEFGLIQERILVPYKELPHSVEQSKEAALVTFTQQETRLQAKTAILQAAKFIASLRYADSKEALENVLQTIGDIRTMIAQYISRTGTHKIDQYNEPVLWYIQHCLLMLKQDETVQSSADKWGNLVSYGASLDREVPTTLDFISEEHQLFRPTGIEEKLEDVSEQIDDMKYGEYKDIYRKLERAIHEKKPGLKRKMLKEAINEAEENNVPDNGLIESAKEELKYSQYHKEFRDAIKARDQNHLRQLLQDVADFPEHLQNRLRPDIEEAEALVGQKRKKLRHKMLDMNYRLITELHTYREPPIAIHYTMAAAYVLLGEDIEELRDWAFVQALLRRTGQQSTLFRATKLDINKVSISQAEESEDILNNYVGTLDEVRDQSAGAARFFHWAREVIHSVKDLHQNE